MLRNTTHKNGGTYILYSVGDTWCQHQRTADQKVGRNKEPNKSTVRPAWSSLATRVCAASSPLPAATSRNVRICHYQIKRRRDETSRDAARVHVHGPAKSDVMAISRIRGCVVQTLGCDAHHRFCFVSLYTLRSTFTVQQALKFTPSCHASPLPGFPLSSPHRTHTASPVRRHAWTVDHRASSL